MVPQPLRRLVFGSPRVSVLIAGAVGLAAASCQTLPLLAPSGSTLTLVPAANSLQVNGVMNITATILQGTAGTGTGGTTAPSGIGQPVHDDTEITFTTTLGTVQPSIAKTKNGQAVVQLLGDGRSGQAKVTAISGAATSSATINVGSASATQIAVTAAPQALPAAGGTSTISATVRDAGGLGVSGVAVSFSTNAGTMSPTTATTNDSGTATATLTTNQAATVTASTAGSTAALTGTVALTVNPKTTITLTPPATANVSTPAIIGIAVGSSATGTTPTVTSEVVDFGDGTSKTFNSPVSSVAHLYPSAQVFTITVTVTDSTGAASSSAVQLAVAPLTASGVATPASPTHGSAAAFTVTPSPAGASIDHFVWDFGDGTSAQSTPGGTNTHTFTTAGSFIVTVTVVPSVGAPIMVPIAVIVS